MGDLPLLGYMRLSTGEQNLDLQRDGLERAGCERVYDYVYSCRATERPGLAKTLDIGPIGRFVRRITLRGNVQRTWGLSSSGTENLGKGRGEG